MATLTQPTHSENISPRQRFQMSGTKLSDHRGLITSQEFQIAIDTALLQYATEKAAQCSDPNKALMVGVSITAAHEFVTVLRKLADKDDIIVMPKPNDNLRS